jgi:hypothetical protein
MRNTKVLFVDVLLVGLGTLMLINEIGISRYPPDRAIRGRRDPGFLSRR